MGNIAAENAISAAVLRFERYMGLNLRKLCPVFGNRKTLYVSDLDGTLLNSHSEVSEHSKEVLRDLIDNHGVLFTVATARTQATVEPLLAGVGGSVPYIVMNGAAMWDYCTHWYVNVRPMHENTVRRICEVYEHYSIPPFIYRNHNGVIKAYHNTRLQESEIAFMDARKNSPYKDFVISENPYAESDDSALIIFSMNRFDRLQEAYNSVIAEKIPCHAVCYHDIFNHDDGILEMYAPGVTKASAVKLLKKQVGANRVVVFGDNLNDMEMMRAADYSVAVENAVDEVKSVADEVIGRNDADSVAEWIKNDALSQ